MLWMRLDIALNRMAILIWSLCIPYIIRKVQYALRCNGVNDRADLEIRDGGSSAFMCLGLYDTYMHGTSFLINIS